MQIFNEVINQYPVYKDIVTALNDLKTPCCVTGVASIHKAQIILGLSKSFSPVLVVAEDEAVATRLAEDINQMADKVTAMVLEARDFNFSRIDSISREYEYRRIDVLSKILNKQINIVIASAEALSQYTIPPEILKKQSIDIDMSSKIDTNDLAQKLTKCGYFRSSQVEGKSQFAIRGSIIDVFPVSSNLPVRIELWGDEIDTISYFDIETQRRGDSLEKISIFPALEILINGENEFADKIIALKGNIRSKKKEDIVRYLDEDIQLVQGGVILSNTDKYISLCYDKLVTALEYFKDSVVVVSEYYNTNEKLKGFHLKHNEDLKLLFEEGILFKGLDNFCLEASELFYEINKKKSIYLDNFMRGGYNVNFKTLINANALQTSVWSGELNLLVEELSSFCERDYCTIVMAGSEKFVPILVDDLKEANIPAQIVKDDTKLCNGKVYVIPGCVSSGYEYTQIKHAMISQARVGVSKRKIKKRKKGEEIRSISDINSGDLVVHSLYGIGIFAGISQITTQGVKKDYITIKYAKNDVLYVPVTQLDLVSRYIGPRDDSSVKLNSLNSAEWQKTRSRVKQAVKDIADELIKLYAKRQASHGYAFSKDNEIQHEFETRFEYNETDDQLRCIEEIKEDMQKTIPMDRLLCGDVGFGKTEVALRAALKCVLDNKQCAILVPTTVLAWQHYQTALKRFEHFPVKIQLLSRFRSAKEQKEILHSLQDGTVDIIIGTHRLVQKDVKFKNLGLVVVDEEQRFGVAHKEKFKEAFSGVDVLTLSATPIPRTLNMAMSGIRDMSIIEEPPQDRHPVQTYVIEHNTGVIVQAIMKEMRRGGQVYYIHNRIETIESCAYNLKNAIPDARIGVAHGRITENALSDIWRKLIEKEIDILICTTIIETGVDVPNVNTLIIEDADRFGLSQLYQLRGRVGRSNRRAFAYLTFKRGKIVSEIASKRLTAIREFTQFGSGFRIAMRDLEIRGAGSILSGKQHGHMESVGYDMYIRLLNEAILAEKGEKMPYNPENCLVDLAIDAYIPEKYIENLSLRIEAYRNIAAIQSKEDSMDVIDELIDRYGDLPKSVTGLINIALMRNTAAKLGITEITQRNDNILFYINQPDIDQIKRLSTAFKGRVLFNSTSKPYISIRLDKKEKASDLMENVINIMADTPVDIDVQENQE